MRGGAEVNLRHRTFTTALALLLCASFVTLAPAADVEKKWRLSFVVGGYDTQDEVKSNSANQLVITDDDNIPQAVLRDPRNDSAVFADLKIDSATRATFAAQYAINKIFIVEGSIGYQKGDVGDIEVQVQFPGIDIPAEEDFAFETFRIPAGEMEQIPIQLSALARFRPRASFNPYFGAGVGYIIVGFDADDEFNQLSLNMDQSIGGFAPLQGLFGGIQALTAPSMVGDLEGADVDARDSFAWHLIGGGEISFKRRWSVVIDVRYVFASRDMSIGFNGAQSLGVPVPDRVEFQSVLVQEAFGPYSIVQGGLVDGGQLVPSLGAPAGTDCDVSTANCEWSFEPDGELDRGAYYVQGGRIKYGGISAQVGVRFTF